MDAKIILAFAQEWEVAEAIVHAQIWELRDKMKDKARAFLNCNNSACSERCA